MATQTEEKDDLSTIRFVSARDRREVFTLPPREKPVLHNGKQIMKQVTFQQISIEPGDGHMPRSQAELEALRESPMNVANGGQVFKEVDVADAPDEAGQETDPSEAGEASTDADESALGVQETITSKTAAAQHLMEKVGVPRESLLTDAGNLSKKKIRDVAADVGVEFPNL